MATLNANLAHYQILEKLGAGGTGEGYKAAIRAGGACGVGRSDPAAGDAARRRAEGGLPDVRRADQGSRRRNLFIGI